MPRTAAERYADCRRLVDIALDGDAAKLDIEVRKLLGIELANEPPESPQPSLEAAVNVGAYLAMFGASICKVFGDDAKALLAAVADEVAFDDIRRRLLGDNDDTGT